MLHKTAEQFYRGLTELFIIKDRQNEPVLPDQYGIDDVPLVVQDKSFNIDGSLAYDDDIAGAKGNFILVNGAITPIFQATARIVRFRVLNGSNARIYNFGFSDNRQFYQVGTDGGLLEKPVPMNRLVLAPAERAEILVDFSGQVDQQVRLVSYSSELGNINIFFASDSLDDENFDVLTINVTSATAKSNTALPDSLASIIRLKESQASKTRKLSLDMSFIGFDMTINGQSMEMNRIDQTIKLNDIEIWKISNQSPMAHPFHIHDIQFQILSRNGQPPPENERGWKDVVLVKRNETVKFIAQFSDFADPDTPFMYHCHILEHEDGGMMGQFVVV